MQKELIILSLFLNLASLVSLSLGVLTPEIVRNLGQTLERYMFSTPRSTIFEAAHTQIVNPDAKKHLAGWLHHCLIRRAVELLTRLIAFFMSILLLLSLSVWGLVDASAKTGAEPVQWGLSVIGLLVCVSGVCELVQLGSEASEAKKTVGKLLRGPWKVTQPLIWLLHELVSIFTKTTPLVWYRSLKAIHSRGVNWLFTLTGILLAIVSSSLQLSAVLMTP